MWRWHWMAKNIYMKKVFDYKFFHFEEWWKSHFTHPLIPCRSHMIYASTGEEMAGGVQEWTCREGVVRGHGSLPERQVRLSGGATRSLRCTSKRRQIKREGETEEPSASRDSNPAPLSCPPLSLHVLCGSEGPRETRLWRGHYHSAAELQRFPRTRLNKGTFIRQGHVSLKAYWPGPQQTQVVIIKDGRSVRLKWLIDSEIVPNYSGVYLLNTS